MSLWHVRCFPNCCTAGEEDLRVRQPGRRARERCGGRQAAALAGGRVRRQEAGGVCVNLDLGAVGVQRRDRRSFAPLARRSMFISTFAGRDV